MSEKNPTEIADVIARLYKLEQNFEVIRASYETFVETHNRTVHGCMLLEQKLDQHLAQSQPVDEKPSIIVASGEG